MKKLVLGAALAAFYTLPALAADLPVKAPMLAPIAHWNWTGCYLGIEGGANWGRSHNFDTTAPFVGIAVTDPFDLRGVLAGGTVGCNYQWEANWVIGIENDFSWTNKKGSANEIAPFDPTATVEVKEHWIDTLRVRLGHTFGAQDQFLLYVTGGVAFADIEAVTCVPAVFCDSASAVHTGWTVGAGGEWAIFPSVPTPHNWWSVKAEYLYVDLGSKDHNFNPALTTSKNISVIDHIVRVGLNWHL